MTALPFPLNIRHFSHFEYTYPISHLQYKMFSNVPKWFEDHSFDALNIFHPMVSYAFLLTMVLLQFSGYCLHFHFSISSAKHSSRKSSFLHIAQNLVKAIFDQAVNFRNFDSDRIFWFTWVLACFWMTRSFQGCLLAKISLPAKPLYFDRLTDVLERPDMRLILLENDLPMTAIKESKHADMQRVWKHIERTNGVIHSDAGSVLEEVESLGLGKSILLLPQQLVYQILSRFCEFGNNLITPNNVVLTFTKHFAVRKGLDKRLKELIFTSVQSVMAAGLYEQSYKSVFDDAKKCTTMEKEEQKISNLNTNSLIFPFTVYVSGHLLAFLVALRETHLSLFQK